MYRKKYAVLIHKDTKVDCTIKVRAHHKMIEMVILFELLIFGIITDIAARYIGGQETAIKRGFLARLLEYLPAGQIAD